MERIEKIVLIGAGNVATQLGQTFKEHGRKVVQVYSRTDNSARKLAETLQCDFTTDLSCIYPGADLYLFSVADWALAELAIQFPLTHVCVAHTSGSLPMAVLTKPELKTGVFYPLQTFSKNRTPDFSAIPFCLESNDPDLLASLHDLASLLSHDVRYIDSQQREVIHIAAVFACNFANHLFSIADELLESNNISFDILHPLIRETLEKALVHKPATVQTGPAVRNDRQIIEKHIKNLSTLPGYQIIYNFISQSITEKSKNKT